MRLLLDTYTPLWFVSGDSKSSAQARTLIEDVNNERPFKVSDFFALSDRKKNQILLIVVPLC